MTTDHRSETNWLTNLFTNSFAGAEKDVLKQDAATAVETETVTGSRATRKCSNVKKPRSRKEKLPYVNGLNMNISSALLV